jgi:hypothetical protein
MLAHLDTLLSTLRQAGLHVGITEVMRLQQVFARQPECVPGDDTVAQRRLKALLRAVIVKSQDEQQTFERVCETWLRHVEQDIQRLTEPAVPEAVPGSEGSKAPPRRWYARRSIRVLASVALVLIAVGVYWMTHLGNNLPTVQPPAQTTPTPPGSSTALTGTAIHPRQRTFTNYEPHLQITAAQPQSHFWLMGLSLLGTLTAAVVWGQLRRRRFLPAPAPAPTRQGPPRVFLTPPTLKEPQFLDARQQETLIWGIGRFVTDEPTRRLDLAATVQATAHAGGIPALHYEAAAYQHEVWLWVDDAAEDSAIARLAGEVEATLEAHGLAVERGLFRGIPERLLTATGAVVAPREVDERREAVLVAVLTDGRVLSRLYTVDNQRVRIEALLRDLSHWPRLAFVDFSAGASGLAALLARHDLQCIPPTALAAFLGAEAAPRYAHDAQSDDAVWAAACALAPSSVDEATALALLQHLRQHCGLVVSPWALRALRAEAPGPAGRLQWPPRQRADQINWLRDIEAESGLEGLAAPSALYAALSFWETQIQQELARREADEAVAAWRDTPAQQHLRMELQLIRLWRTPAEAIPELYGLYQGRLRDTIRQHLRQCAPADREADGAIHLPWSWQSRGATEQAMLQEMGLGGGLPVTHLQRPGRLWLGVGACAGLAMGAALAVWLRPEAIPVRPPQVLYEATLPEALQPYMGIWIDPQRTADGQWPVSVTVPKAAVFATVASAAAVLVAWHKSERPCVDAREGDAELWYCGYLAHPERLGSAIRRSLVVLRARPGTVTAEALALALLDSGSADVVLIAPHWEAAHTWLMGDQGRLGPQQQLILVRAAGEAPAVISPLRAGGWVAQVEASDWLALTDHLRFTGEKPLAAVWTPGASVHLQGDVERVRLHGLGAWPDVAFVDIPAGTFLMGSPDDELGRNRSEGPQHQVNVPAFQMARTETTNAQFRVFRPQHQGPDDLPAAKVTWKEARDFCERYGWRLPTEAAWEYAARAGTHTRWSFGDDERQLGEYAWYSDNAQNQLHPVGRKQANPWGLFDMHGNVWEWVQDCWHDNYDKAPTDGSAWETDKCLFRVGRGGSFAHPPGVLRSARRGFVLPEDWFVRVGFRCVRVPPRP